MPRKEMDQNMFLIAMTLCHCLGLASCLTSFDETAHEKSFDCDSVGRFTDPADCSNYYDCIPRMEVLFNNSSNGLTSLSPGHKGELVAHKKSCFGNAFHPTHKVCVPTHKVQGCIPLIPRSRSLNMAEPGLQELCNIEKGDTFVCSSCKTLLTCVDGVAYTDHCTFGTVCSEKSTFDSAVCYPDYNTECTCNSDQVFKRDHYNEKQFLTCDSEGSEPLIHTCINELNFNEEYGTCCNGNGTECSPSGPFVVKDNCNKYSTFQSTIGGWVEIEKTCRDREMFNEDTDTCENPCTWEITFHCKTEGRFASPSSCYKYFQCIQDPLNSQKFIEKEYDCPNNSEWKQTLNRNDGQCFIRTGEQKCIPENAKAIKCKVPHEWCQVSSGSPAVSPADQCLAEDGVCISTGEECGGSIKVIQKSCLCCITYDQDAATATPTTTTRPTTTIMTTTTTPLTTTTQPTTTITTTTTATTTEAVPCATRGGTLIGSQCLEFSTKIVSWDNARSACTLKGGALASLDDPQAFLDYIKTISWSGWVGASDAASEGSWRWVNGTAMDHEQVPWFPGQPNNYGGKSDCMYASVDGYWDFPCQNRHFHICDLDAATATPTTTTQPTTTTMTTTTKTTPLTTTTQPTTTITTTTTTTTTTEAVACATRGGTLIGSQCLQFSTEQLTWDDAKSACRLTGGALASLDDPQAVHEYATAPGRGGWVGASDAASEGSWRWVNGTAMDHSQVPWNQGQPDNSGVGEDCLWLHPNGFGYYDLPCQSNKRYICDLDASNQNLRSGIRNTTQDQKMNIDDCASPWVSVGNNSGCLQVVDITMDWYNARQYCQANGGDLPIIDTDYKQQELANYYARSGLQNSMFWLGAMDQDGAYVWLNGAPVTERWKYSSQSNEDPGAAMCMYTYTNGQYGPLLNYCTHTLPRFICEQ